MKDELTMENLMKEALALNKYPQIIGGEDAVDYPETPLEKSYCAFLWQLGEALRAEAKK